jgi:hypothetical protein
MSKLEFIFLRTDIGAIAEGIKRIHRYRVVPAKQQGFFDLCGIEKSRR